MRISAHLGVGLLIPDRRDVRERLPRAHPVYDVGHGRQVQLAHLQDALFLPLDKILVGSRALSRRWIDQSKNSTH